MDQPQPNWAYEIGTLLQLRQAVADERVAVDRGWAAVIETMQYRSWQASVVAKKEAEAEVEQYEDIIRAAAITQYKRTGLKKVCPGIAIRMLKRLTYDDAEALSYCKQGFTAALTFDRKALDKMLLSLAANLLPAFVKLAEEPQATIAPDLARATEMLVE